MLDVTNKLDIIKKKLIDEADPLAILLFGSYSRNTQNDESDIDIAFIAENIDKTFIFNLKQEIQQLIQTDIDLINLKDENLYDSVRYEILMNGIVLYCKNEYKYDMYKIDMIREFVELNESRQDIIDRIKNGGTIYGE